MGPLENKNIVLGVTGSISCYKALDISSKLVQEGALVDVIMTYGATQFIAPLSFRSLTHRPVVTTTLDAESELSIEHVTLAERADVIVIAPSTAHTLAKLALGLADDPLTTTILATKSPVIVAPAMDANMYDNPATKENIAKLKSRGIVVVKPTKGRLASGLVGEGRLTEVPDLIGNIKAVLGKTRDLAGRKFIISAGGTQEPLDPARIITNRSSGKMGYALAEAARDRGAHVNLVTAPTSLPDPAAIEVTHVNTVSEMRKTIIEGCKNVDALIMAAAVSDYRPKQIATHKIKKMPGDKGITLHLVNVPDFFQKVPAKVLRVAFAAESERVISNATTKLVQKNLNLIVANDVTKPGAGFQSDTNKVWLITKKGEVEDIPLMSKYEVSHRILDKIIKIFKDRCS